MAHLVSSKTPHSDSPRSSSPTSLVPDRRCSPMSADDQSLLVLDQIRAATPRNSELWAFIDKTRDAPLRLLRENKGPEGTLMALRQAQTSKRSSHMTRPFMPSLTMTATFAQAACHAAVLAEIDALYDNIFMRLPPPPPHQRHGNRDGCMAAEWEWRMRLVRMREFADQSERDVVWFVEHVSVPMRMVESLLDEALVDIKEALVSVMEEEEEEVMIDKDNNYTCVSTFNIIRGRRRWMKREVEMNLRGVGQKVKKAAQDHGGILETIAMQMGITENKEQAVHPADRSLLWPTMGSYVVLEPLPSVNVARQRREEEHQQRSEWLEDEDGDLLATEQSVLRAVRAIKAQTRMIDVDELSLRHEVRRWSEMALDRAEDLRNLRRDLFRRLADGEECGFFRKEETR